MRDRDEWRRPWPAGPAGAVSLPASSDSLWTPASTVSSTAGLEGAFDVVADAPSGAYATVSSQPDAAASLAVPATVLPAPTAPAPRERRRRGGFLGGLVGGVLGAVLTVGALTSLDVVDLELPGGSGASTAPVSLAPQPAPPVVRPPLPDPGSGASVIPDVAELVLPSVVRINASGSGDLSAANALGSGVIYRSDGYIITNHHVIENARAVEVLLSDGDRYEAEIVGSDELNDLALLRIDRTDLPAIALRPIDEPTRVGETVVAIGSPFGLDATVTSGIISALNREILRLPNGPDVIPGAIQTDAAINPGNSGGALVDLQGRLVGINTAIQSRSGVNEGVGFAVPVRQAVVSSDQLIEQGFVRYPLLGITGTDINAEVAGRVRAATNRRGAVVDTVQQGSGAAVGGMRPGDVIVAVDGLQLRSMSDLVAEVRRRAPGMTVTLRRAAARRRRRGRACHDRRGPRRAPAVVGAVSRATPIGPLRQR
jgi:putative serine protease PepD